MDLGLTSAEAAFHTAPKRLDGFAPIVEVERAFEISLNSSTAPATSRSRRSLATDIVATVLPECVLGSRPSRVRWPFSVRVIVAGAPGLGVVGGDVARSCRLSGPGGDNAPASLSRFLRC
jgi:hypothetical protein